MMEDGYAYNLGRVTAVWRHRYRHPSPPRAIPERDLLALAEHYGELTPAIKTAYMIGYDDGTYNTNGIQIAASLLAGRMN